MPKDAKKNVDRYKVKGGELNEFDYHRNQAEYAESKSPTGRELIPAKATNVAEATTAPDASSAKKSAPRKVAKATRATKASTGSTAKKTAPRKAAKKTAPRKPARKK